MTFILRLLCLSAVLTVVLVGRPAIAAAQGFEALVQELPVGGYDETEKTIQAIAATGDDRAAPLLDALGEGDVYAVKNGGKVVIARRDGREYKLTDPLTGSEIGTAASRELDKIRVNNRLRRAVRSALASLTLESRNPAVRRAAAETLFTSPDEDAMPSLAAALEKESDAGVRRSMQQANASAVLAFSASAADKTAAVETVAERGDRDALAVLNQVVTAGDPALVPAAQRGINRIQDRLALWGAVQNVLYGLSLASVLLLAAIGLSITFGVMGVINMAHGEMVMLGAYVTFVVQQIVQSVAPGLFDYSLFFALVPAFLVAGLAGVLVERTVIRWLYGRPLETLLATWGISLILQQAVRSIFGATNREVSNPTWMSGAFSFGELTITYNRLWIFLFAVAVFVVLLLVIKRSTFGLQMRAVTQNRAMASAMGIRSKRVDALTFGLGSGIAGLAGVALSQIDNVSPNLGQGYIIDSFLVVVFGGVGNIWGTLLGALTLGIANKFLEPYAGAVLGKVLILVAVILFIQRRPRGLFALKGRAVEA